MLSFYPGPSKVYASVREHLVDAYDSGLLSVNHRSAPFMELMKGCVGRLRAKLGIPAGYKVYCCASATECWEIISQSYADLPSLHVYNGAFGEKWWRYRQRLQPAAFGRAWHTQRGMPVQRLQMPFEKGLLCLTHNETSNGTQVSNKQLHHLKKRFPQALCCIDATSSMAGVAINWYAGDIWFASVQKCFGLPAGLAVMVCAPKAINWARESDQRLHYNSLLHIEANMQRFQPTHTPNVLGIFLLHKMMGEVPPIQVTARRLRFRARKIRRALKGMGYQLLVEQERLQSDTVIAVKAPVPTIAAIKQYASNEGVLLGNGYGDWKANTFRIANFPAITDAEVDVLLRVLRAAKASLEAGAPAKPSLI